MGCPRGQTLLLRSAGPGEELFARGLEDLSLLEDLAAEHEAALRGDLGCPRQLDSVGEYDAHPDRAGSSRPSRAVGVHCRLIGQVEAEDVGDAGYVESAGAQVARQEIAQLAAGEALEGDSAGLLVHARVDRADREAEGREGEGRLLDPGGHGEEDETALGADRGLESPGEVEAFAAVAVEAPVLDALGEHGLADGADLGSVPQERPRLAPDALGHGGRHEDARTGRRRALEQGARKILRLVREETVGLVQD
jgi:hypothetical protein